jgi:hypothetical protein
MGPPRRRSAAADAVRSALDAAVAAAWPAVRERLDARAGALGRRPADRRLTRQLARQAEQARRSHERAVQAHAAAVARRARVLRSSRRAVPVWGAVAGTAAVAAVPATGGTGTLLLTVAGAGAARAGLAVRRLLAPPPVPPRPSAPSLGPAPVPHPRSAGFAAVRRLEQVRTDLQRLLPLVAPVGRDAAEEAWAAAAEADAALRWQAARLAAAEPYRGVDEALLATLLDGVSAQERLVQAVADLVTASADPHAAGRLQDVTDRLCGLAAGLREVR